MTKQPYQQKPDLKSRFPSVCLINKSDMIETDKQVTIIGRYQLDLTIFIT
jgi:hypothetical protein